MLYHGWPTPTKPTSKQEPELSSRDLTGKSVLLLPLGAADDMAHSQNEKFNKSNYVQGVKILLSYLLELGKA
ncbi:hypothetical protein ANCCEY_08544 [Ancylostoma ceylanicum]|uniref:Peptidase M20 dimerisation domain-containing protein n=1 Tax=Ancylostoma ceylanicum TaxID=53326 RepID=A0A0D6LQV0_9BILA|nr:hypothetical protein ANCCEY_08544 [Ancylostoma ceylanicum]